MDKKRHQSLFRPTNSLKVLAFLAERPGQAFLSAEILAALSMSRAGVYLALQELVASGIASRTVRGRFHLYAVDSTLPEVKAFKILQNIVLLEPVLASLKDISVKMILFGSAARGEDSSSSDIDLFILTRDPEKTRDILSSFSCGRMIQAAVVAPADWRGFRETNRFFWSEIDRGIVLWEEHDESGLSGLPTERQDQAVLSRKIPGRQRTRSR
jgi:predicted nucleotidyltransferase/biotin operon repressor